MRRFLTTVYGIVTTVAFSLGLVVAIIFAVAMIIGNDLGTTLALVAGNIMNWGIALAAIAVMAGLLYIYLVGAHSLVMEKRPNTDDNTTPNNEA